jgi:hypothetical protein
MINVDTVYKTVLLILNKEQRGYMTPDEFNKTATKVQLEIFEQYFDDLSQQLRGPRSGYDYADRPKNIDECLAPFKENGPCSYSSYFGGFELPSTNTQGSSVSRTAPASNSTYSGMYFYKLGIPVYTDPNGDYPVELEYVTKKEFHALQRTDIPSATSPIYTFENDVLYVGPDSIISDVSTSFIRTPKDVTWGYDTGSFGQFIYSSTSSVPGSGVRTQHFELHPSEQSNVINRILFYSGVIIKDPQVAQAAAMQIQQEETNKKS